MGVEGVREGEKRERRKGARGRRERGREREGEILRFETITPGNY